MLCLDIETGHFGQWCTISLFLISLDKFSHFHKFQVPEYCLNHISQPLNHFCETCDSAICTVCKVTAHREHAVVPLAKKYKQLEKELKRSLRRIKTVERWENYVQKSAVDAKNRIQHQYLKVMGILNDICQKYEREIDDATNEELSTFADYADQRKHLSNIGNEIKNVLENPSHTSIFIQQYKELKEKVRASEMENTWKRPVFRLPLEENWGVFKYSQDILGHWEYETIDETLNPHRKGTTSQRSFLESPHKPKRKKSLDNMLIRERSLSCGSSMSSIWSLLLDEEETKFVISDIDDNSDPTDQTTMVCHSLIFFHVKRLFHIEISF